MQERSRMSNTIQALFIYNMNLFYANNVKQTPIYTLTKWKINLQR